MAIPSVDPKERFLEQLKAFVFFHLGADARVAVDESEETLQIRIEHPRVHSFSVELGSRELADLAQDAAAAEDFLLDQLTRHRRS